MEALPSSVQCKIFNHLGWRDYKKLPLICKTFKNSIDTNWKARFLTDFGIERSKYIIFSRWREETLALHDIRADSLRGLHFDMWGISHDPKLKNVYSVHIVVQRMDNNTKCTEKQKNANMALVGRIEWTLLKTGEQIWLNLKAEESGIEYVVGEYDQKMATLFLKGVELDNDGKNLLEMDQYKLKMSKDGLTFEGNAKGSKGNWKNQLKGGSTYLNPHLVEDLKESILPLFSPLDSTFNAEIPIFFNNHLSPKLVSTSCVCFQKKLSASAPNQTKHQLSSFVHYCSIEHRNKYFRKHLKALKKIDELKKEEAYYSMDILEEIDDDEDQLYFPLITFFNAVIQKLAFDSFDNIDLKSHYKNDSFQQYNNLTNTDSNLKLESLSSNNNSLIVLENKSEHSEIDTMIHLKILVDASEVYLSEIEELVERELEDKHIHANFDEYFPNSSDVRLKNLLDNALHLLSRAHKILLTDHDFSKNKSLRKQYLGTKEAILKNLIWFSSKTPHTFLVCNYYKELYQMYLYEILPITPLEHAPIVLTSLYLLTKRLVAQFLFARAFNPCKRVLQEGLSIATKLNNKEWIRVQNAMFEFLDKHAKHNDSLHVLLHKVDMF